MWRLVTSSCGLNIFNATCKITRWRTTKIPTSQGSSEQLRQQPEIETKAIGHPDQDGHQPPTIPLPTCKVSTPDLLRSRRNKALLITTCHAANQQATQLFQFSALWNSLSVCIFTDYERIATWSWNETDGVYKQGSFVTDILNAASAAHCGALWRKIMSLFVAVSISHHNVPTCKVSTSDQL